jgi:hypothetical protein
MNIALEEIMSKLPAQELDESVERNMQALLELLPEKRLRRNAQECQIDGQRYPGRTNPGGDWDSPERGTH